MAATDETRLIVSLEAKIDQFEKKLDRATGVTNTRTRQIEKRFVDANARISRSMTTAMSASVIANQRLVSGMSAAGVAASAAAANINTLPTAMKGTTQAASGLGMALTTLGTLAGAFALRGAQQLIDASIRIENALKVAGLSGDELSRVYNRLFTSAQQNAAPVEALVQLYSRASLVQKELGASTEEMLNFTDKVAIALRVSGRSAAESSGALLQLSQALGSGIVRAEEFNSILEGALPIAQAAAAGLEEAGGSVAKLRKLVVDGKVSSQAFFRAFEAGSVTLEQKVASAELTVSQGFVRLQNVLIDTAGSLDNAVGASNLATDALGLLADALKFIGDNKGPVVSTLRETTNNVNDLAQAARDFWNDPSARNAMNLLFGTGEKKVDLPNFAEAMKSAPKRVKKVSLSDYPDVAKSGDGDAKRTNFEREVDQIKKRTEALRAELGVVGQAALAQEKAKAAAELRAALDQTIAKEKRKATKEELDSIETLSDAYAALGVKVAFLQKLQSMREDNADLETEIRLTGLYGAELEKARVQQELLTEAKRKGVEVTPALAAEIDAIAERNARLKETQKIIEDTRATASDALSGFIKDMRDGTSATESLGNALNRISDKLIDMGTNALVEAALGPLFGGGAAGGGSGGLLGSILGLASGGKVSGPGTGTSDSVPARLSNGEFVVNAKATRKYQPMLEAINSGKMRSFAEGGPVDIPRVSVPSVPSVGGAAPAVNMTVNLAVSNGTPEGIDKLKGEIVPLIQRVSEATMTNLFNRKNRFAKSGL